MGSYNSVFKRVEKKYRIEPAQRRAVEAAAAPSMAVDAYGRTRITSLYLDTPERAMIARSVEKPLYKEKLRLRAYGHADGAALMAAFGASPLCRVAGALPLADASVEARARQGCAAAAAISGAAGGPAAPADPCAITVFFGIKKKFKGIVYKRRLALSLPAALAFVSGTAYELAVSRWPLVGAEQAAASLAPTTRQIARELEAAMDRHQPLLPSMGIACDREAWAVRPVPLGGEAGEAAGGAPSSAEAPAAPPAFFDPELRLTFDDRLEYLDCFQPSAVWRPLIAPQESILEIKSAGPYPRWLVAALSAHGIYPASFTKYGNAYQRCALEISA